MEVSWDLFLKIFVASFCGGLIGWDREIKGKTAGIRTLMLITAGSALITHISLILDQPNTDPTRIIGQIITGIGFLGGGVMLRYNDKIVGATTAAFIWVAAGMGILVGINHYLDAIILTISLIIVVNVLQKFERSMKNKKEYDGK